MPAPRFIELACNCPACGSARGHSRRTLDIRTQTALWPYFHLVDPAPVPAWALPRAAMPVGSRHPAVAKTVPVRGRLPHTTRTRGQSAGRPSRDQHLAYLGELPSPRHPCPSRSTGRTHHDLGVSACAATPCRHCRSSPCLVVSGRNRSSDEVHHEGASLAGQTTPLPETLVVCTSGTILTKVKQCPRGARPAPQAARGARIPALDGNHTGA